MTKDQQREQGKLMTEAADHPEWEKWDYSRDDGQTWNPVITLSTGKDTLPAWIFSEGNIYRRRPEPRIRPWTPEEARGKWVRRKNGATQWLITGVSPTHISINETWISFGALVEDYCQPDGSPCGEVEQ